MTRSEFVEKYQRIMERVLQCSKKTRMEGLLAWEGELDREKIAARDIFEYGLSFVLDGTDAVIIDEILSNIINQEKDEQLRVLMNIQKKAVLCIQQGMAPRLLYPLLNSYTDIPLNEDKFKAEF